MAREYKDSGIEWIGLIPKEWEVNKIGNLYQVRNEKVSDKDYPPLSVTMNGIVPQLETAAKTNNGDDRKLVCKGDFAINSRSDRRGSCGVSKYDGSVSLINTILKPRGTMNPQYYNWLFHTELFADEFYRWGHGIVDDLWTTRWQEMKNISIVSPSLYEQQKIADYLDKVCGEVDEMVALQETMIEELKAYKQSVITEAVTKGLNPNAPMRDCGIDWIGEIPEHWGYIKLKSITERIGDGLHGTPIYVPDSSMYFINGNKIGKKNIEIYASTNKIDKNEFDKYYIELDLKTILISLNGTIGNLSFYNGEDIILGKSAGYIVLKDHISKEYIYYCLQADNIKEYFLLSLSGTTIGNLSLRTLRNTPIALPPLDEQRTIATYLDTKCSEIDSLIALKQAKIEELKEYKKSVIYEYVTGKKEVI